MAYGSTELDVVATTTDTWLNAGTNGIDLFSGHSPLIAILYENSQEPGGDYQFQQGTPAEGNQWKITAWWQVPGNITVQGVTRANQINAFTPAVPGAGGANSGATNIIWPWTHYEGIVYDNYEDRIKNSGAAQRLDLSSMYLKQLSAKFFEVLATDIMDGAAGTISKIQSVNACLLNTGTVGGIDQSDATNNGPWQAQQDTNVETWNTQTFDAVRDACTFDTAVSTGVRKICPDIAFLYGAQYTRLRQELKQSQRQEVSDTAKGGAKYLNYDGCRCYRTLRITSGTSLILNSTTWHYRYATKMPDPVTPGWVPTSNTPSSFQRSFNWMVGFGGESMKHNGYMSNKSA